MPTNHIRAALDLYELTGDPLLLDAVRFLSEKFPDPAVAVSVFAYIEAQHDAALKLFRNSDTRSIHDYRFATGGD